MTCLKKAMQIALHMLSASHASLPEKTWNNTPGAAVAAVFALVPCCSLALLDEHLSRKIGRVSPTSPPVPPPPPLLLPPPVVSPIIAVDVAVAEQARAAALDVPTLLLLRIFLSLLVVLVLLMLRRCGFVNANVRRRRSCFGLAVARRGGPVAARRAAACRGGADRSKVAAKERAADENGRGVNAQATRIRESLDYQSVCRGKGLLDVASGGSSLVSPYFTAVLLLYDCCAGMLCCRLDS